MTEFRVLYLATIVTDELLEKYDSSYYSRAGDNKKRGIVQAMRSVDGDVTIVSPMLVNNNSFRYYSGTTVTDDTLGTEIHVPGVFDAYGLNVLSMILTTTVLAFRLALRDRFDATIFYDFRPEVAVPSVVLRYIFNVPSIVEYEDGLFLHDNAAIRIPAKVLRPTCGRIVDGALCVNRPLAALLPTDNVTIVRGFPSIGMPDDLPDRNHSGDDPVVMFAGRFDRVRGIDHFLQSIPEVNGEVEFWISGYGPDHEVDRVKSQVNTLDDDRITFFGTLPFDKYVQRIVDADVLVNFQDPSHPISEYTFPSKLLDFMSSGSVILSTRMSDLQTSFDGILCFVGQREREMGEAVEQIVREHGNDDSTYKNESAREWVQKNCRPSAIGREVARVVRKAQ